ncbi:MAG: transaldolase [Planctomycetia bacterium]|nr:transaldolase [Planctomycetia bacterium]
MKLFVDTADVKELETCLERGFACGVTTNPMLIARANCTDFREHIRSMIDVLIKYDAKIPLSVEVNTTDPAKMAHQSEEFVHEFGDYPYLNIKIPIGWNELKVIAQLARRNVPVNCTCCMSYNQAVMAARAGARYVSLFWGRIRDVGYDAGSVVRQTRESLDKSGLDSEIIVGSIRHLVDVNEAIQAGGHIITVPPKFFPQMCAHPKTDEAVAQFMTEFRAWEQAVQASQIKRAA